MRSQRLLPFFAAGATAVLTGALPAGALALPEPPTLPPVTAPPISLPELPVTLPPLDLGPVPLDPETLVRGDGPSAEQGEPPADTAPAPPAADGRVRVPAAPTSDPSVMPPSPAPVPGVVAEIERPIVEATSSSTAEAVSVAGGVVDTNDGMWTTIGQATARYGPWVVLMIIAFVVQLVARSAARERARVRA